MDEKTFNTEICSRCFHRLILTEKGESSKVCELDIDADITNLLCFKRDIINGLKPSGKMNDVEYRLEKLKQGIR